MYVCVTVQRKEEGNEKKRKIKEYHKDIVEKDEMERNRNDMKHALSL